MQDAIKNLKIDTTNVPTYKAKWYEVYHTMGGSYHIQTDTWLHPTEVEPKPPQGMNHNNTNNRPND